MSPRLSPALTLDARTGEQLLHVPGAPETFVEGTTVGDPVALLTRIDDPDKYAASYGFVTLPPL